LLQIHAFNQLLPNLTVDCSPVFGQCDSLAFVAHRKLCLLSNACEIGFDILHPFQPRILNDKAIMQVIHVSLMFKLQKTNHESMNPSTVHLLFTHSDAMKHFCPENSKTKNHAPLWGFPTEQFQSQDSNNMACHTLGGMQHDNIIKHKTSTIIDVNQNCLQQSDKNIQKHRAHAHNIVINH